LHQAKNNYGNDIDKHTPIVTRYEFDEEAVKADLPHLVRRTPTPLSLELSTV
jgi:hypothetical protein